MACAKIKRTKYMHNINENAVQGRLSENYLTQNLSHEMVCLASLSAGFLDLCCLKYSRTSLRNCSLAFPPSSWTCIAICGTIVFPSNVTLYVYTVIRENFIVKFSFYMK